MADHPEVIVTKADKGNATVALDRSVYLSKMEKLLCGTETYEIVNRDPTKKICNAFKHHFKKMEAEKLYFCLY